MGIIEVDYFGLQFTGGKGENLWLNLRNRICQQMDNVAPCRLRLRVKFFVEPHLILQEQTRYFFFASPTRSALLDPAHASFSCLRVLVARGQRHMLGTSHCCELPEHELIVLTEMPCSNLFPGCSQGY